MSFEDNSNREKISVLVVDDHPALRSGITALINDTKDIRVVAEAADGSSALSLYESVKPDVTLMDLQLPDIDGEVVIAKLIERDPDAIVIALTTYGGSDTIKRTISAGARGFMLKDSAQTSIIEGIRHVFQGHRLIEGIVAERYADAMTSAQLTDRELEILKIVAEGSSNKLIAYNLHISEATVKNHIANILQKLDAKDRTEAVIIALNKGMIRIR